MKLYLGILLTILCWKVEAAEISIRETGGKCMGSAPSTELRVGINSETFYLYPNCKESFKNTLTIGDTELECTVASSMCGYGELSATIEVTCNDESSKEILIDCQQR